MGALMKNSPEQTKRKRGEQACLWRSSSHWPAAIFDRWTMDEDVDRKLESTETSLPKMNQPRRAQIT